MASGFEDWTTHAFTSAEEEAQAKASVTATETELDFTDEVKSWTIYNDGPNAVHYVYVTGVNTNNFIVPSKAWIFRDVPTTKLFLICASGETATVYGAGFR